MKILTLESSALAASACITEDGKLLAQSYQNSGLTHSTTLLPMVDHILQTSRLKITDMDGLAITAGPGSFTGVRIGIATAKGIAMGADLPCAAVSSLAAMAWGVTLTDRVVCAVMDARAGQVYNALFEMRDGVPHRLTPDRVITKKELQAELISLEKAYILVGDGAEMCYNEFILSDCILAPAHLRYPSAAGAAMEAQQLFEHGETVPAAQLAPLYLRQPQAVRERLAREQKQ